MVEKTLFTQVASGISSGIATAEKTLFTRTSSGLAREIGFLAALGIAWNYTIADGTYYWYPWGSLYNVPGGNYPAALGIGFIMQAFAVFSVVFLTVAMPRSASDYVGVSRVFNPMIGFIETWMTLFTCTVGVGFVAGVTGTWACGTTVSYLGIFLKNAALVAIGSAIQVSRIDIILFSVIIITAMGLLLMLGMRIFKYVILVFMGASLALAALTCGIPLYGLLVHQSPMFAWDKAFGAGAWNEIITVSTKGGWASYIANITGSAAKWGWPGASTSAATANNLLPAVYSIFGLEMANYVAGEIREPSKNFLWSIVAVLAITVVFTFVASFATLAIFGQFASRYTYVWYANLGSQLKINIPMVPSLGLFTGVLAGPYGSWLSVLMASSGAFFIFKSQSMNMLISSRMIFALSFDRMLPTGLSNVNDRFHSPHWAIITVMAIAYLSAVGTVVAPWIAVLNLFAGILWKYFTVGWAAMIMPYSRPDIYERGFTAKLIGIPLTTIIGAISTCLNAFLFYLVLTSLSGQWSSLLLQSGIFAGGLLYYTAAFAYNKSKGIDMAALWQEIPPA